MKLGTHDPYAKLMCMTYFELGQT